MVGRNRLPRRSNRENGDRGPGLTEPEHPRLWLLGELKLAATEARFSEGACVWPTLTSARPRHLRNGCEQNRGT